MASIPGPRILVAALLLVATASTAAALSPRREVLASGDVVAPFGRVGRFSAELRGIDERGRLLVAADLSDGTTALYWLDEHGLEALPTSTPDATLFPATSVSSPTGRVAVRGVRPGERSNPPATVFVLDADGPRPVLSLGDTTVEGLHVVVMNELIAALLMCTSIIGTPAPLTASCNARLVCVYAPALNTRPSSVPPRWAAPASWIQSISTPSWLLWRKSTTTPRACAVASHSARTSASVVEP